MSEKKTARTTHCSPTGQKAEGTNRKVVKDKGCTDDGEVSKDKKW